MATLVTTLKKHLTWIDAIDLIYDGSSPGFVGLDLDHIYLRLATMIADGRIDLDEAINVILAKTKESFTRDDALAMLPPGIKVKVIEHRTGGITVMPVGSAIKFLIAATNEYDHSYELFIQDSQDIHQFMQDYPDCTFYCGKNDAELLGGILINGRYRALNSGVSFMIDSWDFRHMVGGQSD